MFIKMILTRQLFSVNKLQKMILRNISQSNSGLMKITMPTDAYFNHYINLPVPDNKVFATYVWIDGSGINLRSKDRVLCKVPCNLNSIPAWSFDGSSTGLAKPNDSDTLLIPAAVYKDPFRKSPHLLILCETYYGDGNPTPTNFRTHCAKSLSKISKLEPWFGIEQEYIMLDRDLWPLGWPKRGYPTVKPKFSYCGIGEHISGREIVECHARACVYSGMDYSGFNAEVMKGSWEYQVGPSIGIKTADDLWMSRYLLNRIAEHFGSIISYHPKPMGKDQPGVGCHHNFSTNKMRNNEGLTDIKNFCNKLCDEHDRFIKNYGLGNGADNQLRLTGKFETAPYNKCTWGIADRSASIRLQKSVAAEGKGFLEDRRPAGDCDPYRVCRLLAEACM